MAAIALTALIMLPACSRDEVTSYRVPKEASPEMPGANAQATPATAPAGAAALTWQAPAHWVDQGASGMRRGSFQVPGNGDAAGDLSIIAFPGSAGSMAANINRWRGQVGLPNLSPAQVDASIEHTDTAYLHVDLVSMTGEVGGAPTRIDGAIFSYAGESWFIKFMGPADLIANESANFRAFVQTVAPARR
jgi:hypothetical protein